MKTTLRIVVAAVAAFLLISASPLSISSGTDVNVRIADGDAPGGE